MTVPSKWFGWFLAVLGCALWIGCDRGPKPGLELQVVVVGNAAPGERAKRIDVIFDRPMVAPDVLGKELALDGEAPLRLEPAVAGVLRWREDRKLSFEPAEPLPRATAFVVRIPKGTRGLDDVGIRQDFEHRFETERLTLATELARDFNLPDPKQWATPQQKLSLSFNQPVAPERVAASCSFRAVDGSLNVAAEVMGSGDTAREHFEVGPREALRGDTAFRFACDATLSPVEGPLPLAPGEPEKEGTGQPPAGTLDFRTFGPFIAKGISPSGQSASPDSSSIRVHFSTPPVLQGGKTPIEVSPGIEGLREYASVQGADLVTPVSGLEPYTEYTVTVPAGLTDVFGQRLAEPFSARFKTGSAEPGYALDTGSWSVEAARDGYVAWTRNVSTVEVLAAALTEEQLFSVLPVLSWWDREAVDLGAAKVPFTSKVLPVTGEPNRWNQLLLRPRDLLGDAARKSRFYYIASRSPEVFDKYETDDSGKPMQQGYREVLLNVTNLGVTSKLSGNSGLVWVTRLSDGAGQPGAEVVVRERSGTVLWRGTTGADGSATLPGRAALLAKVQKGSQGGESEEEGEYGGELRLLIFARHGDDATFVDPDAAGRFSSWSFGVQNDSVPKEFALRGFLHSDRGLYRPGDTVHLRGLARLLRLNGGLFVPTNAEAEVTVSDPSNREVGRQKVPLSRFGGFSFDHALSELAPLGDYRVRAQLPHGEFAETFTVEEYRAATFEVELTSKQPRAFAGEELSFSSFGRYFYGAPVRSADVTLRVHTRARDVQFAGYEDFSFMDEASRHDGTRPYGEEAFITEQVSKLNAEGRATHQVVVPAEQVVSPSTLLVSATVQDETNQTVTANLTLPLHQTRLYLGVDSGGWVAAEKTPQRVRFVALSPEGDPVAATAQFRVQKQNWSCAWERWGYLGSYRCTSQPEVITTGSVSIGAGQPLTQDITYPGPGEYLIALEGVDAQKRPVKASRSVWVYGSGESAWRADDSGRFEIVADKREYQVGETAKLIVKTAVRGARALVTVERDGVLTRRTLPELNEGQAIEVPITEAFAPNAFVSVLLVRGRTSEGPRGLPQTSMGLADLRVSHADKRLSISLETDAHEYRPGKPVAARLKVTDASGAPVQAELALAAADEGVLSLINFKTPDPLSTFFAPWGLAVKTASQYERLTQIPAPDQERYVTGGDSAGMPGSFRARFRATAYWNPSVTTDAAGEASVTFDAPDNLTAFRLMAVAADATDRFGSGEQRFIVNKPLQIISALPRFLSVGDRFEAAAMLTNDTGQTGVAKVRFSVDGAIGASGVLEKEVTLPASARQRVAFPVTAKGAGSARFRFAASLGAFEDGLEVTLPVHQPSPVESELLSEGSTDKSVNVGVRLPEGVLAGTARLEIAVDPDGLAGIEEGLRELVQYPYGCLEQTTSRLIPLIAARELTRSLSVPEIQGEQLERYIRIAIAKVLRHQAPGGGFSFWPGSEPEAYLTAYALWGLKLAIDAGYSVDAVAVQQATQYLRWQLHGDPATGPRQTLAGELSSRAFALYVLAVVGQPEAEAASALSARAEVLPHFGQAFLARALAAAVGPSHPSVSSLLEHLQPVPAGGAGTIVRERGAELDEYYSTDVRTSAIVTDTLLALRPDDARLPGLIRGLLSSRRSRGGWYTTQENVYALVALTHYAKSRSGKPATLRVTRGDQTLFSERITGDGLARLRRLEVPTDPGDTRPITVAATEGTAHYRVRSRYQRDSAHQSPVNKGLDIRRVFLDPETGAVLERAKEGQMVRVQLTLGATEAHNDVALSDYLPAGLEAINTRFATVPQNLSPDDRDWYNRLWLTHRELGDERVDAFVDWLPPRPGSFEYLARATTVGTFVVPAATAEEMYDPDVSGRTGLRSFEVVARQ